MVTKNSMYSYLHNGSLVSAKGSDSSKMKSERYWEGGAADAPDREDYAHHLRSSSYQVLHSQQQHLNQSSAAAYHSRQPSNASNYSDNDDLASRVDQRHSNGNYSDHSDRSRYLSYDSIGPETSTHKYPAQWNVSEPDLSSHPHNSQNSYYHSMNSHASNSSLYHHQDHQNSIIHSSPGVHHNSSSLSHSSSHLHSSSLHTFQNSQPPPPPLRQSPPAPSKHHSSPPPPPVRDASSLKYIKYGPGHEKFPSWPVPAGSAGQVLNSLSDHETSTTVLSESLTGPQGSHRSKSWTEQSDYPKDTSGGYTRPHHKRPPNPMYQQQLKTVLEKSEKNPSNLFESKPDNDVLSTSKCALMDAFYQSNSSNYPLYDRDGHGIDDKDYNIPSPPERDPGMGEANLSQVTAAQLEEYTKHCDYPYGEMGVTPFLDRLREESAAWDGGSERDSGRGESESMADSFRYSNGRESVTTVVTNSSSASSSETLKWHGSLSDISIMSGHSRDPRTEQNIVHSSRVMAPQRQNSESVLYYSSDKSRKESRTSSDYRTSESSRNPRDIDPNFTRGSRESRWIREVERNNEVNNLKKFPSYSYTQPLSQITEAPVAESHETNFSNSNKKSPTIDISKPPTVAERINELERQSRNPVKETSQRFRDASEPRERLGSREARSGRELRRRDLSEPRGEYREDADFRTEDKTSTCQDYSQLSTEISGINNTIGQNDIKADYKPNCSLPSTSIITDTCSNMKKSKSSIRNVSERINNDQENIPAFSANTEREKIMGLKNFSYLDPKKQCKVPDSTLKNIQKQALMSFVERKTAMGVNSSSLCENTSLNQFNKPSSPLVSKNSFSTRSGSNIRDNRSGLAGLNLARLGRVPDAKLDSPSRPPRKRSVNGRDDLCEEGSIRDSESHRSPVMSDGSKPTPEMLLAYPVTRQSSLPLPSPDCPPITSVDDAVESSRPPHTSRSPTLPPTALDDPSLRPPERPPKKANLRTHFPGQKDHSQSNSNEEKLGRPYYYRRPPAPDPPPSADEIQTSGVRPITPSSVDSSIKVNEFRLNDEFHESHHHHPNVSNEFSRRPFNHSINLSPCHVSLPSIGRENVPPLSPTIQVLASQSSRSSTPDLPPPPSPLLLTEPESTIHIDEQPLPPPPTEITRVDSKNSSSGCESASKLLSEFSFQKTKPHVKEIDQNFQPETLNCRNRSPLPPPIPSSPPPPLDDDQPEDCQQINDGTYHKDSYMAQKKDWKSGFEGRYRRTSSPSASPIRNSLPRGPNISNVHPPPHTLIHHSSTKCLNTYNSNSYSALTSASMLSSSTMALTSYPSNASSSGSSSLSSSLSSSSSKSKSGSHLKHSISSTSSSSSSSAGSATPAPRQLLYTPHIKSIPLDNETHFNNNRNNNNSNNANNGWPGHARQQSTTVNFTTEELRAFRSRKATGEGYFQSSTSRTLPSAISTPTLVQPSSYSLQTPSNQGSSSSLASANIDSPPKISPSTSLRASLDSLHCPRVTVSSRIRGLHDGLPRTVSVTENISSATESMSQCTSVTESLSRSTSIADSLCRSSSVAETASSLSRASSICEPIDPSPTSLAPNNNNTTLLDCSAMARPATVTEELIIHQSSRPIYREAHDLNFTINSNEIQETDGSHPSLPKSQLAPVLQQCTSFPLSLQPIIHESSDSNFESEDSASLISSINQSSGVSNGLTGQLDDSSCSSRYDPPTGIPSPPLTLPPCDEDLSLTTASSSLETQTSTPVATSPVLSSPATPPVTVTIGYGRNRRPEELECEQLSLEYVSRLGLDPRLQALLAPGPQLKTTADYMDGVFTYEVRRDVLASRAHHLLMPSKLSIPNTTISEEDLTDQTSLHRPTSQISIKDSNFSYGVLKGSELSLQKPRSNQSPSRVENNSTSLFSNASSSLNYDATTPIQSNKYNSSLISRSSSYLGTSPAHLSSANQVANFTSISSPIRSVSCSGGSKPSFLAARSLSSPEHPIAFNSSLSHVVSESHATNGEETADCEEPRTRTSDRSPLPSDSAYFSSESKGRLLTRLRSPTASQSGQPESAGQPPSDSQALLQKKEELMSSISRKLEILRAEQDAIKDEMRHNNELGAEVTARVVKEAKQQETDKYKLHVEEIDKITSLLLGLSGRLARAENALLLLSEQDGDDLKRVLEVKRDRLCEQLNEAKLLKENIDRRALQVNKSLMQYLSESEFADYDHFIKMKAKLVMDAREITDKIKLGEEQMAALRDTFKMRPDAPVNS